MNVNDKLKAAAMLLNQAQRLLIGTGAGMSADSGVQTYRKPGQTNWQNYGFLDELGLKSSDLCCPQAFEENPEQAWAYFEWMRRRVRQLEPHSGYTRLHEIAARTPSAFIQTTNIDGYHERAGWPTAQLHEVHGSFWRLQHCAQYWTESRVPLCDFDSEAFRSTRFPKCPLCDQTPRPHILMFADLEYIGHPRAEQARRDFHASAPDVMLVIGESGAIPTHVYDATQLKRQHGTQVIDINPHTDNKAARMADLQIPLGAREALERLSCEMALA